MLGIGKGAEIGAAVFIELNKKLYRPLHDLQWSVIGLLNNDKLVASYDYTAFGEEILKSDDLSPWRFSSKRYDAETDFLYFGRRYYSPKLGRWITPDPIGHEGGPNLYAYVSNNPLMLFDLYGLDAHPCADSVGANWFRSVGDTLSNAWNSVKETCSGFFTSQREVTPDRFKDAVQRGRERSADVPIARLCGVVGHWYLQRYHPEVLKEDGWEAFASVGAEMGSLFVGDLQQAMPAPPVSRVAHPILKSISAFFKKANVGKVKFKSFTRRNFRENLKRSTGENPGRNVHAHHVFPHKYKKDFAEIGINIDDPRYGVWWDARPHLKNASDYNEDWKKIVFQNPNINKEEVLRKGKSTMSNYGLKVNY